MQLIDLFVFAMQILEIDRDRWKDRAESARGRERAALRAYYRERQRAQRAEAERDSLAREPRPQSGEFARGFLAAALNQRELFAWDGPLRGVHVIGDGGCACSPPEDGPEGVTDPACLTMRAEAAERLIVHILGRAADGD